MDHGQASGRPKIREILTGDDLKGLAHDAGLSDGDIAGLLGSLSAVPGGVMQMAVSAGEAFWVARGIKTVKSARAELAVPYPVAVRALVFALTGLGRQIRTAFDTPQGAYFETDLARDLLSRGGTLQFDLIERAPGAIEIAGASEIKGQIYDWGKGKRALAEVMAKMETFARRLGG